MKHEKPWSCSPWSLDPCGAHAPSRPVISAVFEVLRGLTRQQETNVNNVHTRNANDSQPTPNRVVVLWENHGKSHSQTGSSWAAISPNQKNKKQRDTQTKSLPTKKNTKQHQRPTSCAPRVTILCDPQSSPVCRPGGSKGSSPKLLLGVDLEGFLRLLRRSVPLFVPHRVLLVGSI